MEPDDAPASRQHSFTEIRTFFADPETRKRVFVIALGLILLGGGLGSWLAHHTVVVPGSISTPPPHTSPSFPSTPPRPAATPESIDIETGTLVIPSETTSTVPSTVSTSSNANILPTSLTESSTYIDLTEAADILENASPAYSTDRGNPTMEQFPAFRLSDGQQAELSTYYPRGTVWYRTVLSQESYPEYDRAALESLYDTINNAPMEITFDGTWLQASFGERGWMSANGGFLVNDGLVQYVSYHGTLRPGSRFISDAFGDGTAPLPPYYHDSWIFIGEPVSIDTILAGATTSARDRTYDIPVPPPFHANEEPFIINDSTNPIVLIQNGDFSITNYGLRGTLPAGSVTAANDTLPGYLTTLKATSTTLLQAHLPANIFPGTTYRGTHISIHYLTGRDTVRTFCEYHSEPKLSGEEILGERAFAKRPWSEGATGTSYQGMLLTSIVTYDTACLVIDITTKSSPASFEPGVTEAFDEGVLTTLLENFVASLYFEG